MGANKTLVTFETNEDKDEAMKTGLELLQKYCIEVRPWLEEEWCQAQKTWVECHGIPSQAWTKENIKKLAEV